ncbi:MAG TPA: hypothetical protein VGM60_04525 [Pseudonocardia sp.]|uniref:hypothetical protein n=1 Tax=Pseudonocardia sp. TaxID=60912 RepID=UPI002F4017B8
MRDDGVHLLGVRLLGVRLHQGQRAHRATAGAEDRRPGVQVGDQPGQVVGALLRRRVPLGVVHQAAVDAPGVGGEHGVVGGQQVGQRRERPGIHRGGNQHQQRALAAHLVVQPAPWHLELRDGDGNGRGAAHRGPPGAGFCSVGSGLSRPGRIIARERHFCADLGCADRGPRSGQRRR